MTEIYGPVVYRWARQAGLQAADASDLLQDVFATVLDKIDDRRDGRFRRWLWSIFQSRRADFRRRLSLQPVGTGGTSANLRWEQVPDARLAADDSLEGQREIQGTRHRAFLLLRDGFEPRQWEAFWRLVVHGDKAADIAEDLGISVSAVYKEKTRILQEMRTLLEGLDLLPEDPVLASVGR